MQLIRSTLRSPFLRLVAIGLAALTLSSCAAVKLAYEDGETFTMFWAARYISLDKSQDELARPRVKAWFNWHRTTQLPDYARLAADVQKREMGTVTAADIEALEQQLRARWYLMVDEAAPPLADLVLSLRTDQLDQMEKKFASNDDTYRDEFVDASPARRKKDLYSKELDRVEYWYGSLSDDQKAQLRRTTDALPIDPALWLVERQAREKELLALLKQIIAQKPPRESVIGSIRAFAKRLETSPDPGRRTYIDNLNKANREMYVTIANMMTPEQRDHAAKALGDWIQDLNTLAKD